MDLHSIAEIAELASLFVGFAGFIVALMIRSTQAEVRAELTTRINDTATKGEVHAARDEEKFKAIDGKLERIEGKLDRITSTTVVVQQKP